MIFKKTKLILDSREKMPSMAKNFASVGYEVVREALPCGDICVPEIGLLIERKTTSDLLSSISSKRLMIQVNEIMEQDIAYKCLLIEGIMNRDWVKGQIKLFAGKFWMPSHFHPKAVANLLWTMQKRGLIILSSSSAFDSSCLVNSLIQYELSKDTHKGFNMFFKQTAETLDEQKTRLIVNLPGVSVERGKAILEFYQNDVMKALSDVGNWDKNVDGIGKKTREDCQKVLFFV